MKPSRSPHAAYVARHAVARPSFAATSAIGAAIAAFALTACGPRDEAVAGPYAGGAPSTATTMAPPQAPAAVAPQGTPVPATTPPVAAVAPAPAYAPPPVTVSQAQPVQQPPAYSAGHAPTPQYAPAPAQPSQYATQARAAPVPVDAPRPVAANRIGSIESIEPIRERPQGPGAGAVIGGVLGAVVGNQFGHGAGRVATTGVGAVGGAVAGHQVERHYKEAVTGYRVHIRLDNGSTRIFERTSTGNLHVGDRVRVDSGSFHRV